MTLNPDSCVTSCALNAQEDSEVREEGGGLRLFLNPSGRISEARALLGRIDELRELKNAGRPVSKDLWAWARSFVRRRADGGWERNENRLRKALIVSACAAACTDRKMSADEVLALASDGENVKDSLRSWRVGCCFGRIFEMGWAGDGRRLVRLLALSLRRILPLNARRNSTCGSLPAPLFGKLLARLRGVHALRQGSSRMWKVAELTPAQRTAFERLGVRAPAGGRTERPVRLLPRMQKGPAISSAEPLCLEVCVCA